MIEMHYDREADALAIKLRPGTKSARTVRVDDDPAGMRVDFDAHGRIIQVELLDASSHVERAALEALPAPGLTLAAAEKAYGLTASTLRVFLNAGKLRGRKVGRDWLVDPRSIEEYMAGRSARGRPATSRKARRTPVKRAASG